MVRTTVIVAAGLGVALAVASSAEAPTAKLALAGHWLLDAEHSDDPGLKMREAMLAGRGSGGRGRGPGGGMGGDGGMSGGGGRPGGGMGRSGGGRGGPGGDMGGPGGRGGMGQPGDREDAGRFAEPPLDGEPRATQPPAEGVTPRGPRGPIPSPAFVIEEADGALVFTTERGTRVLRPDGEKRKKDGPGGRAREVVTRFTDDGLEVKTSAERGGSRERYRVLGDGRLRIEFELGGEGPRPSVRFQLFYTRQVGTQQGQEGGER